jgi:hypothetical protein
VNINEDNPVRELRSRQITINKTSPIRKRLCIQRGSYRKIYIVTPQNSCLHPTTTVCVLNAYLSNPNEKYKCFTNAEICQFKDNGKHIIITLTNFEFNIF